MAGGELVAQAISILREAVAQARRPVMLYSVGKDSSVLLDLAREAFAPGPLPFPLLHVDTTWKFREMIEHRDRVAAACGAELIVHTNREALARGINPFEHGSLYTEQMKTRALLQALDAGGFDVVLGGARRDEDPSRAKERVFSVRGPGHRWDPRAQRPEFWANYNARVPPGATLRVFPLSDWTELDVWQHVARRGIDVVSLYFAAPRPVVLRDGQWIVVDDARMPLLPGEVPEMRKVRFRTLGCYPLSAAFDSDADTLDKLIEETRASHSSERAGRRIDREPDASMERKKREGYF